MAVKTGVPNIAKTFGLCSFHIDEERGCLPNDTVEEFKNALRNNKLYQTNPEFAKKLAKMLQEDDDATQLEVMQDDAAREILGDKLYLENLMNFKPHGPIGDDLFSNFHLNTGMQMLAKLEPTFKQFPCHLMDFPKYENYELTSYFKDPARLFNEGYLTFGCVLNTLTSDNTRAVGHWVALFGDFRSAGTSTIEYYNSSGNKPPDHIMNWMKSLASSYTDCMAIDVSNVHSQKGPTECGVYAFHYIVCRLLGVSLKSFRECVVPDNQIQKLRRVFFNDEKKLGAKNKQLLRMHAIV